MNHLKNNQNLGIFRYQLWAYFICTVRSIIQHIKQIRIRQSFQMLLIPNSYMSIKLVETMNAAWTSARSAVMNHYLSVFFSLQMLTD